MNPEPAMTTEPCTLSVIELETVYDWLAQAIDSAGRDRAELFLTKLALLNAQALGDTAQVRQHIDTALLNL